MARVAAIESRSKFDAQEAEARMKESEARMRAIERRCERNDAESKEKIVRENKASEARANAIQMQIKRDDE